jgi:hypothetical protein
VGRASTFAVLASSLVTGANLPDIVAEIGVSDGALSTITGFTSPPYIKFGNDSPGAEDRTSLAQQDVTALVLDINQVSRGCDTDLTDVPGGMTGALTLEPGVTCMNSFTADILINGIITLDAHDDPNAFFIIRGNKALIVANGAQILPVNGAQACSVFWRIAAEVIMGTTVQFFGNVISGSAITMQSDATLIGRTLAQTEGVQLDANTITLPSDCTHVQ